jgi:hypothetical protein
MVRSIFQVNFRIFPFLYIHIGTYFVRKAEDAEQDSKIKYFLHFVCHGDIASIPICHDEERRTYWFLSGEYLS